MIPVTLLTGFLGSGKTTLLNALLREPSMRGTAVVINEVGAVGIDHHLVERIDEEIVLLESGCLCCTVRGDLSRTLRELFMRRLRRELPALDRVVIETTGLADPAPVIYTLMHDFFVAQRYRLAAVVTTVDCQHVRQQIEQEEEALKQIAMADRLVLTKADLVDARQLAAAETIATALNPTAQQLRAPIASAAQLFDAITLYDPNSHGADALRWLNEAAAQAQRSLVAKAGVFGAFGADASAVLHDRRISTHVLRFAQPFAWHAFSEALDLLQSVAGDQLLRLKGLVNVAGEAAPRVVHAVQHERYPAHSLPQWPDADRQTRLVFIVRDLPRAVLAQAFISECGFAPEAVS